jgi:hypothetical protein
MTDLDMDVRMSSRSRRSSGTRAARCAACGPRPARSTPTSWCSGVGVSAAHRPRGGRRSRGSGQRRAAADPTARAGRRRRVGRRRLRRGAPPASPVSGCTSRSAPTPTSWPGWPAPTSRGCTPAGPRRPSRRHRDPPSRVRVQPGDLRTGLSAAEATAGGFEFDAFTVESTTRAATTLSGAARRQDRPSSGGRDACSGPRSWAARTRASASTPLPWRSGTDDDGRDVAGLDLVYAPPYASVWDPLLIAARQGRGLAPCTDGARPSSAAPRGPRVSGGEPVRNTGESGGGHRSAPVDPTFGSDADAHRQP